MAYSVYESLPQLDNLVICYDISSPKTIIDYADTTPAAFYDISGRENHANVESGEMTLTTADGVWCLDNPGTVDGYRITTNSDLDGTDFTWVIWLHRDDQDANFERIVEQDGLDEVIAMGNSAQGNMKWYHSGWATTSYDMPITTWTMITLTLINGGANIMYANTTNIHEITDTRTRAGDIFVNGGSNTERYDGRMGYFAMWKSALSQTEVEQVYRITSPRYGV